MIEPTPGFPVFITAETVAPMLGITTPHTFMTQRIRLEEEEGFPPPVAYLRRPLRWRRETVEHWLKRQKQAAQAAIDDAFDPPAAANVVPLPRRSAQGTRT